MPSAFVLLFDKLIEARFGSARAFVRSYVPGAATDEAVENRSQSYLNQILAGSVKYPPLHRVPEWIGALGLQGAEAQRFFDLAAAAHIPEAGRIRIEMLINQEYARATRAARSDAAQDRSEKSDLPTASVREPPEEVTHEQLESELGQQIADSDASHNADRPGRTA